MAAPQPAKSFKPPTWMIEEARKAAARYGNAPDAAAKKTTQIREDPKEAKRRANKHAARMGVQDPAAAAKSIIAAQGPASFLLGNLSKIDEQQQRRTASVGTDARPSNDIAVLTRRSPASTRDSKATSSEDDPRSRETTIPSEQQTNQQANPTASKPILTSKRREKVIEKRDERKTKKKTARLNQKFGTDQSTSESASPAANSPVFAESSIQEALLKDEPDPMDVDHSPLFVAQHDRYPVRTLPPWYTAIKEAGYNMVRLKKNRPGAFTALEALKDCIKRCEAETKGAHLGKLFDELRDHVHKAEFPILKDQNDLKWVLKLARILTTENGLPRIFKEEANFPSDLKADAYKLYNTWYREDFSQDFLRGIVTVKGKDRNGDRLEPAYRSRHPNNAKYHGEGELVLGQWWPTQLCAVRDSAHGSSQGGIYGDKEDGTYSIVLSGGGGYHDKDDGNIIEYSGTDGKNFMPTDATLAMIKSAEKGNEIRVIRSSQLVKKNQYRPEVGLRYDGLYTIKSFQLVDKEKQIHRFVLERLPGQGPIRSGQNASARPTIYEIREYERTKEKW
jgi:hypothetical protein